MQQYEHNLDPIYRTLVQQRAMDEYWVDFILETGSIQDSIIKRLCEQYPEIEPSQCAVKLTSPGEEDLPAIVVCHELKRRFIYKKTYLSNVEMWLKYIKILGTDPNYIATVKPGWGKLGEYAPIVVSDVRKEVFNSLKKLLGTCNLLPDYIGSTPGFIEIEYFDLEEWRFGNNYDFITENFLSCVDEYYTQTKDDLMYVGIDTISRKNLMVNTTTKQCKIIDVKDFEFRCMAIPTFQLSSYQDVGHGDLIVYPDYVWSDERMNLTKDEFTKICNVAFPDGSARLYKPNEALLRKTLNVIAKPPATPVTIRSDNS